MLNEKPQQMILKDPVIKSALNEAFTHCCLWALVYDKTSCRVGMETDLTQMHVYIYMYANLKVPINMWLMIPITDSKT